MPVLYLWRWFNRQRNSIRKKKAATMKQGIRWLKRFLLGWRASHEFAWNMIQDFLNHLSFFNGSNVLTFPQQTPHVSTSTSKTRLRILAQDRSHCFYFLTLTALFWADEGLCFFGRYNRILCILSNSNNSLDLTYSQPTIFLSILA